MWGRNNLNLTLLRMNLKTQVKYGKTHNVVKSTMYRNALLVKECEEDIFELVFFITRKSYPKISSLNIRYQKSFQVFFILFTCNSSIINKLNIFFVVFVIFFLGFKLDLVIKYSV